MSYDLNEQAARNARRDVELAALKAGRDVWKDRAEAAEADRDAWKLRADAAERRVLRVEKIVKTSGVELVDYIDGLESRARVLECEVVALRALLREAVDADYDGDGNGYGNFGTGLQNRIEDALATKTGAAVAERLREAEELLRAAGQALNWSLNEQHVALCARIDNALRPASAPVGETGAKDV